MTRAHPLALLAAAALLPLVSAQPAISVALPNSIRPW